MYIDWLYFKIIFIKIRTLQKYYLSYSWIHVPVLSNYQDNEDLKKKIDEERRQNGKHSRNRRSSRADAPQLVNRAFSKSSFLQKTEETLNRYRFMV